jgi:multidrug resistance protein, MATE family
VPIGPSGIWFGFIGGLAVAAIGLTLRFLRRSRAMPAIDT